ncbi:ABC transporter ATP-binding protein [Paenibacillus sp. FSL W7-1287]|uniref:ABC transporter ATP-binding protein n=1 Tax=Paenibacillus sp. FSL W7-1287 TaxID=2954538 RepID=UPI0030FCE63E
MYIEAKALVKQFGLRTIVNNMDVSIQANEIIAIIGPNGAGKSTMLEMLIGLQKPSSGTIWYWDSGFKGKIGVQLQAVPFFPALSAMENLLLFASFYKKSISKEEAMNCLEICGIQDAAHTEAVKLSGGQQKRLAIAVAIMHEPTLIFLDEPTAALDPRNRQDIHNLMLELQQQGKTIVFTSHDMDEVHQLATRVLVIDHGKIIAAGEPAELCNKYDAASLTQLYMKLTREDESYA